MIPQTYPSTLSANNRMQMVVFVLSDVTGLTRWVDYIPVKPPTTLNTNFANTFETQGYLLTSSLSSISGKQAWLDYIPVYIDYAATIPYSTNASGYIPMDVFAISNLFAAGEQGAWYDPSDFSTMFQDAAGITPVTAVGQPVGRILDKSGRGNHATQTTAASRPVLSARYNLLTKTEQFGDGVWVKDGGCTITTNAITAPDGTLTADMLVEPAGSTNPGVAQASNLAGSYTRSVYFKQGFGNRFPTIRIYKNDQNYIVLVVNLLDGTSILKTGSASTFTNITSSVIYVGNGFYKASLTYSSDSTTSFGYYLCNSANPAILANGTQIYTGDGSSGVYIWGASLVPADQASLPYQRVNTATDYDTVGFPFYLLFDGVDDWLQTANINFTTTNKMTVWSGVRKLSDAANGEFLALGAWEVGATGRFTHLFPGASGVNKFAFGAHNGAFLAVTTSTTHNAPVTRVVTTEAIDRNKLRLNGVAISESALVSEFFVNEPLYIGKRSNGTIPFNGRLYSLIVRGAQSTATEISNAESYVNSKTGAY